MKNNNDAPNNLSEAELRKQTFGNGTTQQGNSPQLQSLMQSKIGSDHANGSQQQGMGPNQGGFLQNLMSEVGLIGRNQGAPRQGTQQSRRDQDGFLQHLMSEIGLNGNNNASQQTRHYQSKGNNGGFLQNLMAEIGLIDNNQPQQNALQQKRQLQRLMHSETGTIGGSASPQSEAEIRKQAIGIGQHTTENKPSTPKQPPSSTQSASGSTEQDPFRFASDRGYMTEFGATFGAVNTDNNQQKNK